MCLVFPALLASKKKLLLNQGRVAPLTSPNFEPTVKAFYAPLEKLAMPEGSADTPAQRFTLYLKARADDLKTLHATARAATLCNAPQDARLSLVAAVHLLLRPATDPPLPAEDKQYVTDFLEAVYATLPASKEAHPAHVGGDRLEHAVVVRVAGRTGDGGLP
jgi:hypothetical protein